MGIQKDSTATDIKILRQESLTTWDIDTMNMIKILSYEEGFSSTPYQCSEGYVTVGYGTKLHNLKFQDPTNFPIKVSRGMAEEWLHSEVAIKDMKLRRSSVSSIYRKLSDDRRAIVLSMAYQMGVRGVLGFNKMWRALKVGDTAIASIEMLDSHWAIQTPERAERHARVMLGEKLADVYK